MKPKISVMMHTASCDYFLNNQGIPSYFYEVTRNLSYQTFKKFEFIYVDTFYEQNKESFAKLELPFKVKHVPIHSAHRYWYDRGNVYISAAKNTGILYADGDLCITFDDSEFFPPHLLELYWKYYSNNQCMHALHKRMTKIAMEDGKVKNPIDGEIYINDHRFKHVETKHRQHLHGSWTYAGTSFALEDALKINGFNERMDGCKSLEDCDFGGRLALLFSQENKDRKFAIDKEGYCFILDHQSYGEDVALPDAYGHIEGHVETNRKRINNFIAIENYGMLKCGEELPYDMVANQNQITDSHLRIIQRETLRYRGFDPLDDEHKDNLAVWLQTPTFNLRSQRDALRKSAEWKWK
jgi:glycosyltransferase involved in cell wall biosynthesis